MSVPFAKGETEAQRLARIRRGQAAGVKAREVYGSHETLQTLVAQLYRAYGGRSVLSTRKEEAP